MAAILINGNGYEDVTAQRDADFYGGLTNDTTGIMQIGEKMRAEVINNTVRVYDGVILTKEGRRVQIDYGEYVDFTIPAGTAGATNYYIIGFKLITAANDSQTCEQFVQLMNSESETISEGALRDGDSEVYISLYRISRTDDVTAIHGSRKLLPHFLSLANEDMYYRPGTVHTLKWAGGGYFTNSRTAAIFSLPLNRIHPDVASAIVNACTISIMQNGTAVVSNASRNQFSAVTVEIADNCLIITATRSSGFSGIDNNSPFGVRASMEIAFR